MQTLITIVQLAFVWLIAYAMGVGIVKVLLPADVEAEHGTFIAPTVGYLTFCFLSFTISASLGLTATAASWTILALLLALSVGVQFRPAWRLNAPMVAAQWRQSLAMAAPIALVTLLPVFIYGAETYLGAVNPDYFAGVMDNYFLQKGFAVTSFSPTVGDTFYPIDHVSGHLSASARFGADMFGILVSDVLRIEMRTALTLSIAFFLLNLPLTMYFLSRTAFQLEPKVAKWSAWLIAVSGPIGMSYLYFYIGQNSGLPGLVLLLGAVYIMMVRPGLGTLVFAALLSNAMFVNYFAMLPYALAPAGALGIYLIAKRRLTFGHAVGLALAFVAISMLLKFGTWRYTYDAMRAWMNVIGQTLQGQFFLEFLTESFIPYFLGVYNYPASPLLRPWVDPFNSRVGAVILGFALLALWVWCIVLWARRNGDKASRVFVISALVIYFVVWWRYSFAQQYGYAIFKMSSWLQFMVAPFFAYGLFALRDATANVAWKRAALRLGYAGCIAYAGLNVVTSLQYAYNGAGRNTNDGYIINHFGTAGNRDYFELSGALARHVRPDQSVGLMFTDSIRNYWASYYAKDFRQSMLSHETMPGDDENLPDVETQDVVDYYGNVRKAVNEFFHGGTADHFYLTWNRDDINQDITEPAFKGPPLWENRSFRLFPASAAKDILFTGRGFYRLEYFKPNGQWYFPRTIRWSADGGEFYLLNPSHPGQPYRLSFDSYVGYEYPSDSRTIELWQDGKKLHEMTITSTSRTITPPFIPPAGITKLVLRIKERNKPMPRRLGIWNLDIPANYRRTNVAFSNVHPVTPDTKPPEPPKLGETLPFLKWHPLAQSFDGIELDGWMGDKAQIAMSVPPGATKLALAAMAPGNLGITYPLRLTVSVNGRASEHVVANAGDVAIEVPLAPGEAIAKLEVASPQSVDIGERAVRYKVVKRSLRLDSLTFRP